MFPRRRSPYSVADRALLHERLAEAGLLGHVEFFEPGRYLTQASIGENIIFGVRRTRLRAGGTGRQPGAARRPRRDRAARAHCFRLGQKIAATFAEMFETVSAASPLFALIGTDDAGTDRAPE